MTWPFRPIHPQAVRGEPQVVRWVVRTGAHQVVGEVERAPAPLGPLMTSGLITRALLETEGIWTWLADGNTWAERGHIVREAITEALDRDGWELIGGSSELLRYVTVDVIEGEFAEVNRTISIVDNDAHWLLLDFHEGPGDLDLFIVELQQRLEAAVRLRYPLLQSTSRLGDTAQSHFARVDIPRRAAW